MCAYNNPVQHLETVTKLRIIVADDEQQLPAKLDYALTLNERDRIDTQASPELLATIRAFLDDDSQKLPSSTSVNQLPANTVEG